MATENTATPKRHRDRHGSAVDGIQAAAARRRMPRSHILVVVVFCLAVMFFGTLDLGPWLIAPKASAADQVRTGGPYTLELRTTPDQPTVLEQETLSVTVRDAAGHPVDGAALQVQPTMVTMPMSEPTTLAHPLGGGRYTATLRFDMPGAWQLVVTLSMPDRASYTVTFDTSVRVR